MANACNAAELRIDAFYEFDCYVLGLKGRGLRTKLQLGC